MIITMEQPSGFCTVPVSSFNLKLDPGNKFNFFFSMYVVRLQEDDKSEETKFLPHKHDIISVLGVGGHWVTSHQELQVSPCQT